MKVAIVGSEGYIAGFLLQRFQKESEVEQIITIDKSIKADYYLDLMQVEEFKYEILREIDYIVFTAAISGPDKCAEDFEECWRINVLGTKYFIKRAIENQCNVLFFSSDAVFGDISGMIYNEESITNPYTPYGKMKKNIEDEFKGSPFFKAIRLSYVVSTKDKFTKYCINCIKTGEVAEIFHPFYRNCISVNDVEDVVMWFALHFNEYEPFVLNVAGMELVSRVRIADEINRVYRGKLKYDVIVPDEEFFVNRPKITQMKSIYMQKYEILDNKTFTEKIQNEFKENDYED